MRTLKRLVLIILVMAFQPGAFALEPSASVKAVTVLKAANSWDGKPIEYPAGQPEMTCMVIEIAPGGETGWHLHSAPALGMVLEGEVEVQLKNGSMKRLKSGEAMAEVVNTLHNGRNVGTIPAKLVVFYAGSVGQKLSAKENVN